MRCTPMSRPYISLPTSAIRVQTHLYEAQDHHQLGKHSRLHIRTFYPMTAKGKVENIELAPSSMTIMLPDPLADTALINIAFLLIIKMGVSNPSFACKFQVDESPPLSNYHSWHGWPFWRYQKHAQFIQS
ncbi:hypothetical protein P3342_002238 [Pyrenophora teres f. teres]|nr:hypothetical protein P3342_002238 [Pyrenophora teres f. teres]